MMSHVLLASIVSRELHVCSSGVEVSKPTHFTIYTKGAGKATPEVHFTGAAKGEAVRDFEIIDNHDYSYTVRYTAVQQVGATRRTRHTSDVPHIQKSVANVVSVSLRETCPSRCVTEETPFPKVHLTSAWPPHWTSTKSKCTG